MPLQPSSSGSPVAVTNGAMTAVEGCAAISDSAGNLLFYTNGETSENGFLRIKIEDLILKNGFYYGKHLPDKSVIEAINQRFSIHQIKLSEKEITEFDVLKIVNRKDVGVNWLKK